MKQELINWLRQHQQQYMYVDNDAYEMFDVIIAYIEYDGKCF